MIIGVIQDKIFVALDKQLFPHKYQAKDAIKSARIEKKGLLSMIADYVFFALGWISLGIYFILLIQEFVPVFGDFKPLSFVFGGSVRVIHIIFFLIVGFKAWKWYQERTDRIALQSIKLNPSVK